MIKWNIPGWLTSYGGLDPEQTSQVSFSTDKTAAYVPCAYDQDEDGEDLTRIKKNSKVELVPVALTIPAKRYRVMVECNPKLYEVAQVQYQKIVEPDTQGGTVYCKFTKDFDLSELEYLVRYYLIAA